MTSDKFGRARQSPRKVATRKFATFVSPRVSLMNNKTKYLVVPQTVAFQTGPSAIQGSSVTAKGETTVVIDLERSDTSTAALTENPTTHHLQAVSTTSLQGQNTRSQPHLSTTNATNSTSKRVQNGSKPAKNQRLRRSRSHARIASLTSSQPMTEQRGSNQAKSVSMEDISSPTQKEEQKPSPGRKGTTISRPIVRKPNFDEQNNAKQNAKSHAHSVYGGRPYIIPMAKRIIHRNGSPYPQGLGNRNTKKKRVPLIGNQYPHLKRKARQELPMAKGK